MRASMILSTRRGLPSPAVWSSFANGWGYDGWSGPYDSMYGSVVKRTKTGFWCVRKGEVAGSAGLISSTMKSFSKVSFRATNT